MKTQRGISLIELIIFIVILGVVSGGMMLAFNTAMHTNPDVQNASTAVAAAQSRMEIILGQKYKYGFAAFTDPCTSGTPPALCTVSIPSGWTVSSSIANNWSGNTNYKVITVTVSGNSSATLTGMVANF